MNKFEQQYRQWGAIALATMVMMILVIALLDYLLGFDISQNFYLAAISAAGIILGVISMSWIQVLNSRLMRADIKRPVDLPAHQAETRKITLNDIKMCVRKEGYIPQMEDEILFFNISGERFDIMYHDDDEKFSLSKRFSIGDDTDIDIVLKACSQTQDEVFMLRNYTYRYDDGQPVLVFEVETFLQSVSELERYFPSYLNVLFHAIYRHKVLCGQFKQTEQMKAEEQASSSSREANVVS